LWGRKYNKYIAFSKHFIKYVAYFIVNETNFIAPLTPITSAMDHTILLPNYVILVKRISIINEYMHLPILDWFPEARQLHQMQSSLHLCNQQMVARREGLLAALHTPLQKFMKDMHAHIKIK
jgi:hypothetical protein